MSADASVIAADSPVSRAHAHLLAGEYDLAAERFQRAVEEAPQEARLHAALGLCHLHAQRPAAAVEALLVAVQLDPSDGECLQHLALAHLSAGDAANAFSAFQLALQQDPTNGIALFHLGQLHKAAGDYPTAEDLLKRALINMPGDPQPFAELADLHLQQQQFAQALEFAKASWQLRPNNPHALRTLTTCSQHLGDTRQAVHYGLALVALAPEDVTHLTILAGAHTENGDLEQAVNTAQKAVALGPGDAQAHAVLACALTNAGDWHAALEAAENALTHDADTEEYIVLKASLLQMLGRDEEAFQLVAPLVRGREQIRPDALLTYAPLAGRFGEARYALGLLDSALGHPSVSPAHRLTMAFTAGALSDKTKAYNQAFARYRQGNALKQATYSHDKQCQFFDAVMRLYTAEYFASAPRPSQPSTRPIFIVGMPRSGTSLVERILASHPEVFGAGETTVMREARRSLAALTTADGEFPNGASALTPEHVDEIASQVLEKLDDKGARGYARVTEKLPHNFIYLGLIATLFPDAVIVHCRRDPRDTCLSCYFQNFSASELAYSYDLTDLGRYYRAYERMMTHWHEVLPGKIYDLRYEDLVSNPEQATRSLLEHCALAWDEACLSPHKLSYVSSTASFEQVRRPIHRASVDRWRHYRKHLQPLLAALEPAP